jgi:hypothetical protein
LDGLTSHGGDGFLDECTYGRIETFFSSPHSSDQTEPVDLWMFDVEKDETARTKPMKDPKPQTRQVIKVLNGY